MNCFVSSKAQCHFLPNGRATCSLSTLSSAGVQDRAFTRMFGTTVPRPLPIPSYIMFTLRDGSTVGASFNLPAPVSLYLQENFRMTKGHADVTSQVSCPAAENLKRPAGLYSYLGRTWMRTRSHPQK